MPYGRDPPWSRLRRPYALHLTHRPGALLATSYPFRDSLHLSVGPERLADLSRNRDAMRLFAVIVVGGLICQPGMASALEQLSTVASNLTVKK